MLVTILLVAAFILFLMAGLWPRSAPTQPPIHLGWLGAACAMLAFIIKWWPH